MKLYPIKLRCPKCGFRETDKERFVDTEVSCEDCGSHSAIRCPKCNKDFDSIYEDGFCEECYTVQCKVHKNTLSWEKRKREQKKWGEGVDKP